MKKNILTQITGLCVFAVYAALGPGIDFNGYRLWVLEPSRYEQNVGIFSPAWLAPLISPFITMPGRGGYVLFMALTVVIIVYAARLLGGYAWLALLSAPAMWVLWWGQIDGLAILGLAIGWSNLPRPKWAVLTMAMLLATLKPQVGLIPIIAIWWWSGRARWAALAAFVAIAAGSVMVWGPWPVWVSAGIRQFVAAGLYANWNVSIGPNAMPLLLLAVFMPLDRRERLMALTATALLISHYMPFYSTLVLLCFPIPAWLIPVAFLGYFPSWLGTLVAWNGMMLLPMGILIHIYTCKVWHIVSLLRSQWYAPHPTPN